MKQVNFILIKLYFYSHVFNRKLVQSLSRVQLILTPWTAVHQAPLSSAISQSLLIFMNIESVMLSNHLILCHPLLLPSIYPSIRSFPMRWLLASGSQIKI